MGLPVQQAPPEWAHKYEGAWDIPLCQSDQGPAVVGTHQTGPTGAPTCHIWENGGTKQILVIKGTLRIYEHKPL